MASLRWLLTLHRSKNSFMLWRPLVQGKPCPCCPSAFHPDPVQGAPGFLTEDWTGALRLTHGYGVSLPTRARGWGLLTWEVKGKPAKFRLHEHVAEPVC